MLSQVWVSNSAGTTQLPGLACSSGSHSNSHKSVFSKEEGGMGPLALAFVTGSTGGQCNSPFPKEQEQQWLYIVVPLFECVASLLFPISSPPVCCFFLSHCCTTYLFASTLLAQQGSGCSFVFYVTQGFLYSGALPPPWPLHTTLFYWRPVELFFLKAGVDEEKGLMQIV